MKHKLLHYLLFFGLPATVLAQTTPPSCASDYWHQTLLQAPDFATRHQAYETQILHIFEQKTPWEAAENDKTIPVVVHIIHQNGPENITDAQVQQAINWLNLALANQGVFEQGSGVNCGIQLCLARRTPDNLPTNGITRTSSALTTMEMETQNLPLKNLMRWEPEDYLNIWVVNSICSINYGCGVYGFAHLPYAHGSNIDGIVMEAAYLTDQAKVAGLAHEMGHYLGLYHTFEGGCNNNNCLTDGDRICDTPPDQSTSFVACGAPVNTCNTDIQSGPFTTDQLDMNWNFMDYGQLACFHDFTPNQSQRMNLTLEGVRKSLLQSRGCQTPCPAPLVVTLSGPTSITAGQMAVYVNTSLNNGAVSWFVDGQLAGNQNTLTYTFPTPGVYTINMLVQSANPDLCDGGSAVLTVTVNCPAVSAFTLSNAAPDADQMVYFTNNSQNATETEWYINGAFNGAVLDSMSFSAPGAYLIQLVSGNGACRDTQETTIYVQGICVQKTFRYAFQLENRVPSRAESLLELPDGHILSVHSSRAPFFEVGASIIKSKPNGEIEWIKELDTVNCNQTKCVLSNTSDGGFLAFWTHYFLLGSPNIPLSDSTQCYLGQFTSDGVPIWVKTFNTRSDFWVGGEQIQLQKLQNGEIALRIDDFIGRFNESGDFLWAKHQNFRLPVMHLHANGEIIGATSIFGRLLVTKLDDQGNTLWANFFESPTSVSPTKIMVLPDSSLLIAGIRLNSTTWHTNLIKISSSGAFIWSKSYRQIPNSTYELAVAALSANNQLTLAGNAMVKDPPPSPFKPYQFILGIDTAGNLLWSRHRPGTWTLSDNIGLAHGGFCFSALGPLLLKTDPAGNAGDCPESPHEVFTDTQILNKKDTLLQWIDTIFQVYPTTVNIYTQNFTIDTLCAPTCEISVEICNNNLDDDGDGLFDCLDSECPCEVDSCSPKEGNRWFFGIGAGINFNSDPPVPLPGGQTFYGGSSTATQCDAQGNLLFYSDGEKVFNRFHQAMPNGNLLATNATENVIIVPYPGQWGKFYLIIQDYQQNATYSVIDMSLDDGWGDVVATQKLLPLGANLQGIAAVKSCEFDGYWVVSRTVAANSAFLAYRITSSGLEATPVVSTTGTTVSNVVQIKFSPDGEQIACSYWNGTSSSISLHRLHNDVTGLVYEHESLQNLEAPLGIKGIEFSPNGSFLYASGVFPGNNMIVQYDLHAGSISLIRESVQGIYQVIQPSQGVGLLQLGPDGRIYVPIFSTFVPGGISLAAIHQPNNAGTSSEFILNSISPGWVNHGICNVPVIPSGKTAINLMPEARDTVCVSGDWVNYALQSLSCSADSVVWKVDGLEVQLNPNGSSANIRFNQPGSGLLTVTAYSKCHVAADTLPLVVLPPVNQALDLGPDLEVCDNGVFHFDAGPGFARYLWSNGSTESGATTLFPGKYWVTVWDGCGNAQSDTIEVSIAQATKLDLGPDIPEQCSGFTLNFPLPQAFTSWQWTPATDLNCTDCALVNLSPSASGSWVVIARTPDGCVSVDTLLVRIRDTVYLSLDTMICANSMVNAFGTSFPANTELNLFRAADGPGCDSLIQISVQGYPALSVQLPQDTSIRIGASVQLEASVTGAGPLIYAWWPEDWLSCTACPDPLADPLDSLTYTLAVSDANGCTAQDAINLYVSDLCMVHIPTAFTPNGDGANDLFRPIMDPCVRNVRHWRVVNRWGETVWEQYQLPPDDAQLGWNGQWGTQAHPSDVLIWMVEYELFNGVVKAAKGEVTLLR
ncbi:MAG: gliding motility-associated C-terminal domain-containing protein [Saprospiraceae bacterium]|nr:gliding motility-associated C-terminal domain-containing protein [Saprospiraceae bacterium]